MYLIAFLAGHSEVNRNKSAISMDTALVPMISYSSCLLSYKTIKCQLFFLAGLCENFLAHNDKSEIIAMYHRCNVIPFLCTIYLLSSL